MITDLVIPDKVGGAKFIFFSGKGGVGKSTMSCATAVWLAGQGYKTLLVTTDPAPNLSDIFGHQIGPEVTTVPGIDNLSAVEINPDHASEEYRNRIIAPMRELLDETSIKAIGEQLNSPCVEEVAAFDKFIEFMCEPQYDVVIFDTAPTGHTIRLLELPSGWSEEISKGGGTCIGPSSSLTGAKARYDQALSYLRDMKKTSFIFVLKPERLSIVETRRSSDELSKLGIPTSLLIVNGILPEEAATDPFFRQVKANQQRELEHIDREFADIKRVQYMLKNAEVKGNRLLEAVGEYLFEGRAEVQPVEACADFYRERSAPASDAKAIAPLLMPVNGYTRYVFFTGKGGVGKSTIACAVSTYLASRKLRTLIVTTDPAAHLQHIFELPVGSEPTPIQGVDGLYAARIDQKDALEEYKKRILGLVKDKGESTRKSVEEDLNSPCAEEMAAFEKFMSYFGLQGYDVIIFDTAPTGHTLRLLELPTDWKGFIDIGTLTKESSNKTAIIYDNVIESMRNPDKSSFIFVMYPEYTPIMEALRSSADLEKQVGIRTAGVAVNYMLPENYGKNAFFDNRRRQQHNYLDKIREVFNVPLLIVPLQEKEPGGVKGLIDLGEQMLYIKD